MQPIHSAVKTGKEPPLRTHLFSGIPNSSRQSALDSVSQLIEADMNFQKSLTEQGVELKSCAKFHVYTKFPHTFLLHYEVQN